MVGEKISCGECVFFDLKGVDSKPFGTTKIAGVDFETGVCRAPRGLAHGAKIFDSNCTQPPGVAKKK